MSKETTPPVICSSCKQELTNYKDIAAEIRFAAAEAALKPLTDAVISVFTTSPYHADTIRSQTLSRLKDSADPYRQSLDTNLRNVAVLDIDEATRVKRAMAAETRAKWGPSAFARRQRQKYANFSGHGIAIQLRVVQSPR